jgi:hypothetical protein
MGRSDDSSAFAAGRSGPAANLLSMKNPAQNSGTHRAPINRAANFSFASGLPFFFFLRFKP